MLDDLGGLFASPEKGNGTGAVITTNPTGDFVAALEGNGLRVDDAADHGFFVAVWDAARRAGAQQLTFNTVN